MLISLSSKIVEIDFFHNISPHCITSLLRSAYTQDCGLLNESGQRAVLRKGRASWDSEA